MALPSNHLELTVENDVSDISPPVAPSSEVSVNDTCPNNTGFKYVNAPGLPPPPYEENSIADNCPRTTKEEIYAGLFSITF